MQERLAELARDKEKAAGAECTFAPVINGRSSRLMANRSTALRVHPLLSCFVEGQLPCITSPNPARKFNVRKQFLAGNRN